MLLIPETLVTWTVTALFHKEITHISICAYVDKPVSSLNAVFGESVSKYHALRRELIKQREFFFFFFFFWLRADQVSPGLSLPLSSTALHLSVPDGTPVGQYIYQKGDSVCVTLQLDNWNSLSEM